MAEQDLKELLAGLLAEGMNRAYPDAPEPFTTDRLVTFLEKPKNPEMGLLALPAFRFAFKILEDGTVGQ